MASRASHTCLHSVNQQTYGGAAMVMVVADGKDVINIRAEVGTNRNLQMLDLTSVALNILSPV